MEEIIKAIREGGSPFQLLYERSVHLTYNELYKLCQELLYCIEQAEYNKLEVYDILETVADNLES